MGVSNRGNALISVMIAAAIIGILMSVLATMMSNVNRESSYTQQKTDSILAQTLITQGIVNNSENCSLSIQNKSFSVSSPPVQVVLDELVTGPSLAPSAIVKTSSSSMSGGLLVNSIVIKNILPDGIIGNYKGDVEVQFNNKVRQTKNMIFPIQFTVSIASDKMTVCRGGGSTTMNIEVITGTNPGCPVGKEIMSRKWTTPTCVNYGNPCGLYQGWSGFPPTCESCLNWEQCHMCGSTEWSAVACF